MIFGARVLGEPANHAPFPLFSPPTYTMQKLLKIIQFLLYLLSKSIRNCIFKASGEAKMQTSLPVPTMVAPTIHTHVKILAPTFQKTRNGL